MEKLIRWGIYFGSLTLALALALTQTGCVLVAGTPEGIRAYGDYQVGAQKTAKEGPDSENQYFKMRTKSFWEKVTESQPTEEIQGS